MNNENNKEQSVVLRDRCAMELTGITDVESFTDNSVVALSELGNVAIDGEQLKIESFSTDSGRLVISGKFDGFCYFGRKAKKRRLFSREQES